MNEKRQVFSLLPVALLTLAICGVGAEQLRNFAPELTRALRVTSGVPLPVIFRTLYEVAIPAPFLIVVEDLPTAGTLLSKKTGDPITTTHRTADNNEFIFSTPLEMIAETTFNISINQEEEPKVRWATIVVRIAPARLYARTMSYQTYVGQSRDISLEIRPSRRSFDKLLPSFLVETSPLKRVDITTLPQGCSLFQWDGTAITSVPAEVSDGQLRVKITPDSALTAGLRCTFYYRGISQGDVSSNDAAITLKIVDKRGPFAYSSRMVYRLGVDDARPMSLKAAPPVAGEKVDFYLMTTPSVGNLYITNDPSSKALGEPLNVTDPLGGTLVGSSTSNYRVVLFFRVDAKDVEQAPVGLVTFSFKARTANGDSPVITNTIDVRRSTAPICGVSAFTPVFWDKPVNPVRLNYSDPTGHGVDRIVLSQIPGEPIGRLYFRRVIVDPDATLKTGTVYDTSVLKGPPTLLEAGAAFNDRKDGVYYAVLPSNRGRRGLDVFYYRVFNQHGESCRGTLTFDVKPHDGAERNTTVPDASSGKLTLVTYALRRETAKAGAFTLLPLWGTANRSLIAELAVITTAPAKGELYELRSDAPYEEGRMYRQSLSSRPYCKRYDCSKYKGQRLQEGSAVTRTVYGGLDASRPRLFVLYWTPLPKVSGPGGSLYTMPPSAKDFFEYQFEDKSHTRSITQRVEVYITRGSLPVITVNYAKKDEWDWLDYNSQRLKAIRVRILNESEIDRKEVLIMKQDLFRRHGRLARYQLFEFDEDGPRVVPTKEIVATSRNGIEGLWVSKGAVALVPSVNSRAQKFTLRARIYTKGDDGSFKPDAFDDFRINVVRQNIVPMWINGTSNAVVFTDSPVTIDLVADDLDGDTLQFKVIKGPKYGTLTYIWNTFLVGSERPAREGSLIVLPRGTPHTAGTGVTLSLVYRSVGRVDWKYPLNDTFSVVADDGSGINSEPWTVQVEVRRGAGLGAHATMRRTNTTATTGVLIVALLLAGGVLVVVLRRRRAKARYMQLPRAGDAEMGPLKVVAPKVAMPAAQPGASVREATVE